MSSKRCFKCLETKTLDEFYKHSQMLDNRLNKCIECTKADAIKNRLNKVDYYREYDRARASRPNRVMARLEYQKTDAGKEAVRRARKKYIERNPKIRKAQITLGNAIRDGLVQKQPCFICGKEKVEGHHPDYSAPLSVVWLCRQHHALLHKEANDLQRELAA